MTLKLLQKHTYQRGVANVQHHKWLMEKHYPQLNHDTVGALSCKGASQAMLCRSNI